MKDHFSFIACFLLFLVLVFLLHFDSWPGGVFRLLFVEDGKQFVWIHGEFYVSVFVIEHIVLTSMASHCQILNTSSIHCI